ncbi:glycoside hydrolase [Histoplasma capsulatum var. duboisii H88]|uniref:beta-N-acetylhexosaminidase n=1 Tax=Ajellomyces capsulatus (strain H88) TaxID=544711 RepID=F0UG25_AJEC8|nr:glycoside hydrolase [Histoplasma capsulatum var. duboisii H88]
MRLLLPLLATAIAALQTLPPVDWPGSDNTPGSGFSISEAPKTVYIDEKFSERRDENGLTLIPPSGYEFAETFLSDLEQATGEKWTLQRIKEVPSDVKGIILGGFRQDADSLTYEDGTKSEEGYELEIKNGQVFVGGTGARGMYWGTHTFLQLLLVHGENEIPAGRIVDAPAYASRGYLLDAGRKWYTPSFLKELCTYASFFKMSEFQYHSSDNYPLNRGLNDTWYEVYSQFSLHPENEELKGVIQRANETLSRADFEDLQQHCARRGVTIIPEIEAPGHCLFLTKWKPELALEKKDLLDLTNPDSIPLVKSIWEEFLPWFQTKEVHIGADEYDPTLADVYIHFVNEMAKFVKSKSGKDIRIWGTYEPSDDMTISKDIIIQHWQYGQSDPILLNKDGYRYINSEDWWGYMSLKSDHTPIFPATYPQFFNNTRTLNFANKPDWQWEPSLFNPVNVTEQVKPGVKGNKGAIIAAWNDNGPFATTQLEAFYAMRNGIPVVAARMWAGSRGNRLDAETLSATIELLTNRAPGQNLDRRLPSEKGDKKAGDTLLEWSREKGSKKLGQGSKGMNYTLILDITGPFKLTSNDTSLSLDDGGNLVFNSDNWAYPLRSVAEGDGYDPGHPGRIWTNVTSSTHKPVTVPLTSQLTIKTDVTGGSRAWIDGKFSGRFEVYIYGGKNTLFSWNQMALVAPLDTIEGDGLKSLTLKKDITDTPDAPDDPEHPSGTPPAASSFVAKSFNRNTMLPQARMKGNSVCDAGCGSTGASFRWSSLPEVTLAKILE